MNRLKVLPLIVSTFLVSVCGTGHAQYTSPEEKLYGAWNCKVNLQEEGVNLSLDYDVSYIRNGKSNTFGTLIIKAPDIPEMEYSIAGSSSWEVDDGYLIETTEEVKIVNISHPELDEFLNLEGMFPQSISESSEILVLNDSLLEVESETDGTVYSCDKVAIDG